jgi:hypothetical protein
MKSGKELLTSLKRTGKTSPLTKQRETNINWVSSLNREGLAYQEKEVLLDLHETEAREMISIQFPGKESDLKRKAVFKYDFRPKVRLADGSYAEDLTFFQIWQALFDNIPQTDNGRAILGVIFYRMAFMIDYVEHSPLGLTTLSEPSSSGCPLTGYHGIDFESLKHHLSDVVTDRKWAGMSFEAFLRYNDLLALNEDVKYWYRATHIKKGAWKADAVGRVNTLLTHLSVIGFHCNKMNFASLMERFSRSKGVCAAKPTEAVSICSPYLIKS